jgi:2-beta-glucuronyltransferase
MRAIVVTGHYLESKRKAGFHNLAESLAELGWDVVFWTTCCSWLSVLRRDYRLEYPLREEANRLKRVTPRLSSYVWFTPWHPANLRLNLLNLLSSPVFSRYGELRLGEIEAAVGGADLFIFESMPGLLLAERCRRLNPSARYIYRVSDDVRLLRHHPVVITAEDRLAGAFDLVSTPSEYIQRRFAHLPNAALHFHGLDKAAFDVDVPSPFAGNGRTNLVFVGNSHFDYDFLGRASRLFPEVDFHIIGPIPSLPERANVIAYGEIPFRKTIPYLKHADAGLQIRSYSPGAESLTDSLKVMQYTYCRLPIIAPDFLRSQRDHLFCYRPGEDASIRESIAAALKYDRSRVRTDNIDSWIELTQRLLRAVHLGQPKEVTVNESIAAH